MALQGLNIMLRVNGAVLVSDSGGLSIGNFDSRDDGALAIAKNPSFKEIMCENTNWHGWKPAKSKTNYDS